MLLETIKYLTTPCAQHIRAMGYLKELIALQARYGRCKAEWRPHLVNTQAIICDAINATRPKRKAVVLGAGILSDIPVGDLSAAFDTVQLVDICFLRQTQKDVRTYRNVTLQSCDITGLAAPLHAWSVAGGHLNQWPAPSIPPDVAIGDADLVVSANVISQLPLVPMAYLGKANPSPTSSDLQELARRMIENHLALLSTCPGTVCLISEVERHVQDGSGAPQTEDPLFGVSLDIGGKEWLWDVAPRGEIGSGCSVRNRVVGNYWRNQGA